jgi:hypothetical protein
MAKARDAMVAVRMPEDLKEALKAEADRDQRSLSSLVTKILFDWIEERRPKRGRR